MEKSKKPIYTDETKFTFYKDNLVANKFELSLKHIKEAYLLYLSTKDQSWILYYGHQTVLAFIGEKDGLSSTFDFRIDDELADIFSNVRHSLPCYQKFI